MSQLLSRIMLAIFMLPCAAVLYVIVFAFISDSSFFSYPYRRYVPLLLGGLASCSFVAGYWTLLWRTSVRWTARRVSNTLFAAGISLAIGTLSGAMMSKVSTELAVWIGTLVAPLVWLIFTTLIWRETPQERADRATGVSALTCPTCGYNLTGLQSTRCPECGTQFSLDELLSRQKSPHEL